MWQEFTTRNFRAALIFILASGFLLRLLVVIQPVNVLVEKNLPDDAYYYFVIAHNTVSSNSVSLDGESVTNGFHPLWWLILLPIFGSGALMNDLPVHLALGLGALFDVVTIWAIGQISARLGRNERIGLLAAFLYCINPIAILQATNGLETAIAMATLSVFLWLLLRLLTDVDNRQLLIWVGIFLGLAFLARSDNIFTLGIALLGAWCYWGFKRGQYNVFRIVFIAGVLILPWFIWSYLYTGSLIQESGLAVPFAIRHRLYLVQGEGLIVILRAAVQQLTQLTLWLRGDPTGLPFAIGILLWILAMIGLAKRWHNSQVSTTSEKIIITSLLGGGLLLLIFHAGVRFYPRIWYFSSMSIAFSLVAALVLESISNSKRLYFYLIVIISAYFIISGFIIWTVGYYPWQREMLAANRWLSENVPPGE